MDIICILIHNLKIDKDGERDVCFRYCKMCWTLSSVMKMEPGSAVSQDAREAKEATRTWKLDPELIKMLAKC